MELNDLYKKVAKELQEKGIDVDAQVVERVFTYQFLAVRRDIISDNFEGVRLKYIGSFAPKTTKENILRIIEEANNKKDGKEPAD